MIERKLYMASNSYYKSKMRYIRKRDKKIEEKSSNDSTTGNSTSAKAAD